MRSGSSEIKLNKILIDGSRFLCHLSFVDKQIRIISMCEEQLNRLLLRSVYFSCLIHCQEKISII